MRKSSPWGCGPHLIHHPTQHPKRQLDRFTHFRTTTLQSHHWWQWGAPYPPQDCPFPWGNRQPRLPASSLDPADIPSHYPLTLYRLYSDVALVFTGETLCYSALLLARSYSERPSSELAAYYSTAGKNVENLKVKQIWILLEQVTMSDSGISSVVCKSAPRPRQITTPAPYHSVFYRPNVIPAAQPTAIKHWRHAATDWNIATLISSFTAATTLLYTVSQKVYHPTTNDNFKSSCLIPVIFGTNVTE